MIKRIFSMPLRASQGFMDSVFRLAQLPLRYPHYSCISRRAKDVDASFRTKAKGPIQYIAIDATGLKVYGGGEWKGKKHGTDGKRRVWPKLHLAVDTSTHEIIAAELSLSTVRDAEVQPNLLKQTRRKILDISGDGAYDTRDATQQSVLDASPSKRGRGILGKRSFEKFSSYLQKAIGSNKHWKKRYGYHKRSLSETAMYRVKQLLGGRLSLRNYNAQVSETYAMIKALNKLTELGMPKLVVLADH
ncbi:IS5 family transposase [Vibrio parahaemolyticus]